MAKLLVPVRPLAALALSALLSGGGAFAAPTTDLTTPAMSVESWLSQEKLALYGPTAEGDLDGNGTPDWAGVVMPESATRGGVPRMWVAVLLSGAQGGYHWAVSSQAVQESGMGCCWPEQLEIRNRSLYVTHVAKDAYHHSLAVHQFRKQQEGWRLIGRTLRKADARTEVLFEEDWNVLTGQVRQTTARAELRPHRKLTHRPASPVFLQGYDFGHRYGEPQTPVR